MDKTIEERAKEYADRHKAAEMVGKIYDYERIYNAEVAAYERGATDQKAIEEEVTLTKYDSMTGKQLDREECFTSWYFQNVKGAPTFSDAIEWARKQTINEACEWIDKYLHLFVVKGNILYPKLAQEFRKTMEE